ncbi:MAG TPA: hypothetical protein VFU39_04360 [Sulfuricaulis sp.]|nr:hypothetical protein [Sulfuricaulis sp.]
MNRYPLWKYFLVLTIVVVGFVYALPNLYGEYPAVQISPTRTTIVDQAVLAQVKDKLSLANIPYSGAVLDEQGARIRFTDTEIQIRARDLIQKALGDNYVVALNLLPATPAWLAAINARPMYLGLDLRGGVHFLMQVDTAAVLKKAEENYTDDMRRVMREARVQYLTVSRLERGGIEARFRSESEREKGLLVMRKELQELDFTEFERGGDFVFRASMKPATVTEKSRFALEQNINSLQNRVNELGVAEPVIQQQGSDRIVVQLPGVQDTARAKEILGRTATLEIMMVDEEHDLAGAVSGQVPPGSKLYKMRDGRPILLKNRLI